MSSELIAELVKIDIVHMLYINFNNFKKRTVISCNIVCDDSHIDITKDQYIKIVDLISRIKDDLNSRNMSFTYSIRSIDSFYNDLDNEYEQIISANILYNKNEDLRQMISSYKVRKRVNS